MRPLGRGPRAVAVVPAGGTGVRMGARTPKQYLTVGGVPLLVHTLRVLARARSVAGIVLAVPRDRVQRTEALLRRLPVPKLSRVVAGGADRQESVWLGLQAAPAECEWILVHDAVRPFIVPALVERVLAAAAIAGAASCGLPVRETVKRVRESRVEATLDREGLWLVQTPQAFRRDLLSEAHEKARRDGYSGTDDAVLVERLGARVAMVPGLPQNLKITTPADLRLARLWTRTAISAGGAKRPRSTGRPDEPVRAKRPDRHPMSSTFTREERSVGGAKRPRSTGRPDEPVRA
ncbi:MAG: 2-C-methyl-D-erythritol 4-phosphate cytidylyltransferase, partial [candidate division NC10 bacterium]